MGDSLKRGATKSCGCLNKDLIREVGRKTATHGHTRGYRPTPTRVTWCAMKMRCSPEVGKPEYAGRGISVCERWRDFANFLADMGERPEGMTLDRIDPNGNYEPGNCRWATPEQQMNNRRNNRMFAVNGETLSIAQLARKYSVPDSRIRMRLAAGLPMEEALVAPSRKHGKGQGGNG